MQVKYQEMLETEAREREPSGRPNTRQNEGVTGNESVAAKDSKGTTGLQAGTYRLTRGIVPQWPLLPVGFSTSRD